MIGRGQPDDRVTSDHRHQLWSGHLQPASPDSQLRITPGEAQHAPHHGPSRASHHPDRSFQTTCPQPRERTRSPISWMVPALSFVPAFVVAGRPRHDFLLVAQAHVVEEVLSRTASQDRCLPTVMFDDDFAALPSSPRESVGVTHRSARSRWSFAVAWRERTEERCEGSAHISAPQCQADGRIAAACHRTPQHHGSSRAPHDPDEPARLRRGRSDPESYGSTRRISFPSASRIWRSPSGSSS